MDATQRRTTGIRLSLVIITMLLALAASFTLGARQASADATDLAAAPGQKVTQVALGKTHSAAITNDGTLWTWGGNAAGQLGDGTHSSTAVPHKVTSLADVTGVSLGTAHSAAIDSQGRLWTWGDNSHGQLGDGTTTSRTKPVQVTGVGQVKQVACGDAITAAIDNQGRLWMWGNNGDGQLGNGTYRDASTPQQVRNLTNVAEVTINNDSALVRLSNGDLYTWGWFVEHRAFVGGAKTDQRTPTKLNGISRVAAIASGGIWSAVTASGSLYTWGTGEFGQLGQGHSTHWFATEPQLVKGLPTMADVAVSRYGCAALSRNGDLYTWGTMATADYGEGQLTYSGAPARVYGVNNLVAVSAGHNHAAVIDSSGRLFTWGWNGYGQLGDGTMTSRAGLAQVYFPVTVPMPSDQNIAYVYRLFNPNNSKHFFTVDANEANTLQGQGWRYEGIGWNAPKTSDKPVYRLYNQWSGEHLYTSGKGEYDTLVRAGWTGEGAKFYSATETGRPAYRLFNPWSPGVSAHHYTIDSNERATLRSQGWRDEGTCWYALK